MSGRYVSADLLFQVQNAAIDLARQLGAAEAKLEAHAEQPVAERGNQWRMEQVAISTMSLSNTREAFKAQRLSADHRYRTPALNDVEIAIAREIQLIEKLRIAEVALEKLSRLGNGDQRGNSEGNLIAQYAIKGMTQVPTLDTNVKS